VPFLFKGKRLQSAVAERCGRTSTARVGESRTKQAVCVCARKEGSATLRGGGGNRCRAEHGFGEGAAPKSKGGNLFAKRTLFSSHLNSPIQPLQGKTLCMAQTRRGGACLLSTHQGGKKNGLCQPQVLTRETGRNLRRQSVVGRTVGKK